MEMASRVHKLLPRMTIERSVIYDALRFSKQDLTGGFFKDFEQAANIRPTPIATIHL